MIPSLTHRIAFCRGHWVAASFIALLLPAIAQAEPSADTRTSDESKSDVFRIGMKPCNATRPSRYLIEDSKGGGGGVLGLLFSRGRQKVDKLSWRGEITVDGEKFGLYLPKSHSYSTKNTGREDGRLYNTSTLISIDSNHDGKLSDNEGWYANLPIRIGDQMFEVVSFADDEGIIEMKRSDVPLQGAVVGRKCPPFLYTTSDGKTVSLQGYEGKAFLLDIWSVT